MSTVPARDAMISCLAIPAALLLLLASPPAATAQERAQSGGDAAAGAALAGELCARCHAIDGAAASPTERAPPFPTLGERYPLHYLEEAMAEGLMVAHSDPPMPEFVFTPEQIADLLAFLESVADDS